MQRNAHGPVFFHSPPRLVALVASAKVVLEARRAPRGAGRRRSARRPQPGGRERAPRREEQEDQEPQTT
jgi:hypothetical protein